MITILTWNGTFIVPDFIIIGYSQAVITHLDRIMLDMEGESATGVWDTGDLREANSVEQNWYVEAINQYRPSDTNIFVLLVPRIAYELIFPPV